jgi:hypothetical protein
MDVKTILLGSLFDKSLSGYDLKSSFPSLLPSFLDLAMDPSIQLLKN